jgi:ribosome biogenesis GTPase
MITTSKARVIAEHRGSYIVKNASGEYLAKITGKQMFMASKREDYPAVGDWVLIEKLSDKDAVIRKILPRKTILKKKYSNREENQKEEIQIIATNVDVAFIVESVDRDYNLNRLERFLVLAKEGNITPVVVLNKTDLISDTELESKVTQIKNRLLDCEIITTSNVSETGLQALKDYIKKGKTYCFLGSSGVGKSSLINSLLGGGRIKTQEINTNTERGRHTTTAREVYFLDNGGIVIDNPGTREVGIADSDVGIENTFDEINLLSQECRFSDCTHINEPGCAVLEAIKEKRLNEDKYNNYLKLKSESDFYKMSNLEKREKDRKFGKFVKKALEQLEKNLE